MRLNMRLNDARALVRGGRFSDALQVLDSRTAATSEKLESDVLRAALFERIGRRAEGRQLAERVLRIRHLPPEFQSDCWFTLALLDLEGGSTERALDNLDKALELAHKAKDLSRACWIHLRLMVVQCSVSRPSGADRWMRAARAAVNSLGDPLAAAAMYSYLGEVAIKHGALEAARRWTALALSIVETNPNAWLSALALNNFVALAIIECDFPAGIEHATTALQHALASGGAHIKRACLGNIGNLHVLTGSWNDAKNYLVEALNGRQDGEFNKSILESLARLHLLQGHSDDATECLDAIESAVKCDKDATVYAHRHSRLTRAHIQLISGLPAQALATAQEATILAERSGDRLLEFMAALTRAEILAAQSRQEEAVADLAGLGSIVPTLPIEALGHYERTLGLVTAPECGSLAAEHFRRAARTFKGLRHEPGLMQVRKSAASRCMSIEFDGPLTTETSGAVALLHDIVNLLLHACHPRLLAIDLVALAARVGAATRAAAVECDRDGNVTPIAQFSPSNDSVRSATVRRYEIGTLNDKTYEFTFEASPNPESVGTLNAIGSLLAVVGSIKETQRERQNRINLWPADEPELADDGAIVVGAMRTIISQIRKIAPTNAPVLITGESGTGKEIVARAVHRYSGRSRFPFVPFNCTAVPRDLLEGHLFGYRRGAFTGADRDHPGIVRSARNGTLFLDEIGELSLDLQPKLLRFLESGEITPLGETLPISMSARIVAATNADLEELTSRGHFRSDLYYRLCVVPIRIPPLRERRDEIPHLARYFLAKAAGEFGRGHLTFGSGTIELLQLYSWPGNLRQLNNEIRRLAALSDQDDVIAPELLSDEVRGTRSAKGPQLSARSAPSETLGAALARVEREMIVAALQACGGRLDDVAKALGISRKGLYLKRLRLGL